MGRFTESKFAPWLQKIVSYRRQALFFEPHREINLDAALDQIREG